MSLKQKEEITIWAFKDGKKGHEKQIEALIYEFSTRTKVQVVEIDCSTNFKNWPQNFKDYPEGSGAGSGSGATTCLLLREAREIASDSLGLISDFRRGRPDILLSCLIG